tara:strand:- start:952 stop:1092 length:141 start_codon:yes stop_codon:yes gene_type:complete
MKFILTCENGKQIDMSSDVLEQMEGRVSREEVQERIKFYQRTNRKL